MRYQLVSGRKHKSETILTVRHYPGFFATMFGRTPYNDQYIGFSTVWRRLSDHRRCSTPMESLLADFCAKWKWEEERNVRGPQDKWCPVHMKWETPEEDMACDDELHRKGFRNVGGAILKVEKGEPEDGIW